MSSSSFTRREFITASTAATAAALLPSSAFAAEKSSPTRWPVGCFNRAWTKWSTDETLDAIKGAGYKNFGMLTPTKDEPFTTTPATPESLAKLKQKIAARGLTTTMTALWLKDDAPLAEEIANCRQQLTNAHTMGVSHALTFGVNKPENYAQYYKVMADAAAFAQERNIKLVLKPHGGGSGAAEEILRCIKQVGHPNFKIWYDAGNIIYYTGKDPVAELDTIVQHVTGFCAKDVAGVHTEPMIQFGAGKVDFAGVFKKLKSAGFNGPIMVEGCQVGATPQATMENAKANRLFLEKVLASV